MECATFTFTPEIAVPGSIFVEDNVLTFNVSAAMTEFFDEGGVAIAQGFEGYQDGTVDIVSIQDLDEQTVRVMVVHKAEQPIIPVPEDE